MKILHFQERGFSQKLDQLSQGLQEIPRAVRDQVEKIFEAVVKKGDSSLFAYTWKLDRHRINTATVRVSEEEMRTAEKLVNREDREAIKIAAQRIRAYHQKQKGKGFRFEDRAGTVIEERVLPLTRVGICIPAGRAPLASTVLMTAIPARIAGVKEVIMISAWPQGRMSPPVLVAAQIAGVTAIYKVSGAQGVAALAAGTESIPRVDKIVGPGNLWVTAAKAYAFSRGLCGIDTLAGPSEVMIVADDSAPPAWIAADLLSQAEHGEDSLALLVTTSLTLVQKVKRELHQQARQHQKRIPKSQVIAVVAPNWSVATEIVNRVAPEHLELMLRSPRKFLAGVQNAASIFLGPYSPVPVGDYMAGANHVLPTAGAARFSSPLSVHDFIKRQSVTTLSANALHRLSRPVAHFALLEGLPAHAQSALIRNRS